MAASSVQDTATLEGENDLKQFLKVVRPDWSKARMHRRKAIDSDITRVVEKLQAIGVKDTWDLMSRVTSNRINEDLSTAGYSRFSRETLDCIKKQTPFFRALENLTEANYRQTGLFAPVPQLLSRANLRAKADASSAADQLACEASFVRTMSGDSQGDCLPAAPPVDSPSALVEQRRPATVGITGSRGFAAFGHAAAGAADEEVSTIGFSSSEPEDLLERPPKLRGYRGNIRGTGFRPVTSGSLPSLHGALARHYQPSRSGTAMDLGSSAAAASTAPGAGGGSAFGATLKPGTLGASLARSKLHAAGASSSSATALGGSFLPAAASCGGASLLVERTRSMRACSEVDRPGSPKSGGVGPGGSIPTLEAELAELQLVAARAVAGGDDGSSTSSYSSAEEAYEKLARLGEEDLFSLRLEQSFADQRGSDMQLLRISAHYAKHGLAVSRVTRALRSGRSIGEVRRELDGIAIARMQQVGEAMATQPRDPNWASYGHGAAAAAAVVSAAAGGGVGGHAAPAPGGRSGTASADGLVRHACRMVKEQECLQDKARLYRIMEAEGPSSPTRRFIAGNIRERMQEEKDPEAEKMEVQQTCNNIRRQLTLMGNAQRDLKTLKRTLEAEYRDEKYKEIAKAAAFHKPSDAGASEAWVASALRR